MRLALLGRMSIRGPYVILLAIQSDEHVILGKLRLLGAVPMASRPSALRSDEYYSRKSQGSGAEIVSHRLLLFPVDTCTWKRTGRGGPSDGP